MADTFTKAERSEIMRRVRGRDTSAEMLLRKAVWASGLRGYRIAMRSLPGAPDLAFTVRRVAVFVDGCFWHGCPRHCRMPSSNQAYWDAKIRRNMERDRRNARALRREGWKVVRLWEHDVRAHPERAAGRVARALAASESAGRRQARSLHSRKTASGDSLRPRRA